MTWKKLQRLLACLLAVLLLSQVGAFSPAVLAADDSSYTLHGGTAVIPAGTSADDVNRILAAALVDGFGQMTAEEQQAILDKGFEYYCTGTYGNTGLNTHDAWGSIGGFTSTHKPFPYIATYTYTHPALADNKDGDYKVRLAGTTAEVTLTKAEKLASSISLKQGASVKLPYSEDGTLDFDALRAAILQQVVDEGTTPSLTPENTEIKYYATSSTGLTHEWVKLDGDKVILATYPAISAGDQQIQISFKGDDTYKASSETTTVTFTERPSIEAATNENPTFKLDFTADGEAIYNNIKQQVFGAVVESTNPALTVDDVTIEYYATATTGALGEWGHAWMPLEGGEAHFLTYPAIGEGTQQVRITWGGSKNYAAWQWQGNVVVTGREAAPFQLKQSVTEVGIVYNADQSINYAETAQALREALIESTDSAVSINDLTVEYNAGTRELKNFQPLDFNGIGFKFGLNGQTIRFTWRGNADYMAYTQEVDVTMVDNRQPTEVVLKSGASITYNMDANVMLQAIFENLIDWDASKLPEKGTLSADDFTIEYYATPTVTVGNIGGDVGLQKWVPIEGEDGISAGKLQYFYPQMGAGDQKIRVTYKGNADYRPSTPIEGNLTVNKAKVSVKVHSTSIYADEELSKDFITTDPADNFDIFTVFGGVTSDVTGSVFVQLPERLTKGTIITAIDKTLEGLGHKTLTQMMQEGTTVGELRKLLSDIVAKGDDLPQPVKDLLKKAGIDIDTLVKLNEALNKFPGLLDNVRVAFGTPDQAGIYTVCAVTNNKNYETGFGMGALVVKKHYSGVKLQWNQTIPNGKLTAEQAADFDFGVTLMYNGDPAAKQTNVHYLYSGFTSKWKVHSSTTTPPTEPGRYVMTVVTLGGNYQAAPITRSFQITK